MAYLRDSYLQDIDAVLSPPPSSHDSCTLDPSPRPDIPNETLSAIIEYLPPPTLAEISRVSHRFQAVAERHLYSSITICDTISAPSPSPWRTFRCCQSILQRVHFLDAVRKFHIRWQTDPRSPVFTSDLTGETTVLTGATTALIKVLHTLTLLESLEIFLGPANFATSDHPGVHVVEQLLDNCNFPHLRYCSLGAEWAKGLQTYTQVLDHFLISVPSLRHLKLSDHSTSLNLPPEALPSLSSFRGSANAAASILPGRPVQYLYLLGHDSDVNRDNLPRMAQTSVPLRCLDLSAMSVRPTLLRNVSNHLSTVEILKIRLALRHTLHFGFTGIVSSSLFCRGMIMLPLLIAFIPFFFSPSFSRVEVVGRLVSCPKCVSPLDHP